VVAQAISISVERLVAGTLLIAETKLYFTVIDFPKLWSSRESALGTSRFADGIWIYILQLSRV
jgi:hypothetical protein